MKPKQNIIKQTKITYKKKKTKKKNMESVLC